MELQKWLFLCIGFFLTILTISKNVCINQIITIHKEQIVKKPNYGRIIKVNLIINIMKLSSTFCIADLLFFL